MGALFTVFAKKRTFAEIVAHQRRTILVEIAQSHRRLLILREHNCMPKDILPEDCAGAIAAHRSECIETVARHIVQLHQAFHSLAVLEQSAACKMLLNRTVESQVEVLAILRETNSTLSEEHVNAMCSSFELLVDADRSNLDVLTDTMLERPSVLPVPDHLISDNTGDPRGNVGNLAEPTSRVPAQH